MTEDKKLYKEVSMMCANLEVSYHPKLLLVNMVCRKVEHPNEKMDEIMEKITRTSVPESYKRHKGKQYMHVSSQKELETLESELHECSNLPEELFNGKIIANTVKIRRISILTFFI